jgi:hypothetical protein
MNGIVDGTENLCYLFSEAILQVFEETTHVLKKRLMLAALLSFSTQFCKQFEEGEPPAAQPTVYIPPAAAQPAAVTNATSCDVNTMACPPTGGWSSEFMAECQKGRTAVECAGPIEKTTYDAIQKSVELNQTALASCKTRYVNGVVGNEANFRSSPQYPANNIIRANVPNGTTIAVASIEDPWIKTTLNGQTGYLHKTVLSCDYIAPSSTVSGGGSSGGGSSGGGTVAEPASKPASNGGCSGSFPNRCTIRSKGLRPQINCWAKKQVGGYTIAGVKVDTVDDDRLGLFGGERDCFTNLKDIRVQWGLGWQHRNAAARFSKSWGCYVEVSEMSCDCGNLKCN